MISGLLLACVFAVSVSLTGVLRGYALRKRILDVPSERSSHTTPTPRGGGVAIVVAFLASTMVLMVMSKLDRGLGMAVIGGGSAVALVGFLDDHASLRPRVRLAVHFAAAAFVLIVIDGLPPISIAGRTIDLAWSGTALALIGLVWLLNLYNFMDGIDGLAGLQAVSVCIGIAFIHALRGDLGDSVIAPLALAASAAGFVVWNFPTARIFMGDAGSGFLGLVVGALMIADAHRAPQMMWAWLILMGVFVVDATITLIRRVLGGSRFAEAHRSHAYQQASRRFRSHKKVTMAVAGINLGWLLPLAALVGAGPMDGLFALGIAYTPLVVAAFRLGSGAK